MRYFFIVIILILMGCGEEEKSKASITSNENQSVSDLATNKTKKPIFLDSALSLEIVKNIAESYNPSNTRTSVQLPELSDTTKVAFEVLKEKDKEKFTKYISLIFIKLYRSNLRTSYQSFEIRKQPVTGDSLSKSKDFLVYEFNSLNKAFPKGKRVEFYSSGIAEEWVRSNPKLLKNKEIKKEMKAIQSVSDSIIKELYWN